MLHVYIVTHEGEDGTTVFFDAYSAYTKAEEEITDRWPNSTPNAASTRSTN